MNEISANDLVVDMKTGWNLGNTLDATGTKSMSSETSWGMPKTTKAMIDGLADYGIKTIRIPVSWSNHIIDSKYTIDPAWMSRVKEIVDWAIGDGMYVIIDDHHDNYGAAVGLTACKGYYPNSANYEESSNFLTNVWTQVALAFNNGYDEHLIFETMNEPRLRGTDSEWNYSSTNELTVDAQKTINKLNQDCVDAIRKTGGNNAKRFIMIPGFAATPAAVLSDEFVLPKDKVEGKILISVHMYTPYSFAGQSPGAKTFLPKMQNDFVLGFKKLNEKFVKNNVGVVIGEYGVVNKNNLEERVKYFTAYLKFAKQYNLCPILWDNGQWKVSEGSTNYSEKFGYYNRKDQTWYFPEISELLVQ
ncbi:glycoside hydrolase family 5 protein [Treponema sp.]|uniref:glycoside hydrolase family 5 protein n=1 Tax=Treponema sp. TaxID=166 RepID=UPI00298DE045|nr:glycoside hydrolase family 5 protein [Treponema sp.]MCQ2242333.1 glycoside hydrolase family 5 protein [Treponema sp.]